MTLSYPLADSMIRIKNGQRASLKEVQLLYSNLIVGMLKVMHVEGYILGFEVLELSKGIKRIRVKLKYLDNIGVIDRVKIFSKPGCRLFVGYRDISKFYNGLGILILSTSKGVMNDYNAIKSKIGGEVLCGIF